MAYSVLIVDDHELFSTVLRIALRGHNVDAYQVSPTSREDILTRATEITPGLAVLDLDLGRLVDGTLLHGSDLVAALCDRGWKVLIVSGSRSNRTSAAAAVMAGAIGVLPKTSSFDTLLHTVVKAATGRPVMSKAEYQAWVAWDREFQAQKLERARRLDRLTRREREVLELLAEGHRAAAIKERSVVSMTTVRSQIASILAKLEVNSQLEAVALLRQGPSS
jgi:DNA-binding NarL/FixJ family response regulator